MFSRAIVIKIVKDFATQIKNNGVHLKKVVLFGSYAKGQQHQWSDIDVALVADEFEGFGFEDKQYFSDIHIKKPYYFIQTRTYNTKDFSLDKDPFVHEILKTGIEIKI